MLQRIAQRVGSSTVHTEAVVGGLDVPLVIFVRGL